MPVRLSLSRNSQFEEGKSESVRLSANLIDGGSVSLGCGLLLQGSLAEEVAWAQLNGHFPEIKELLFKGQSVTLGCKPPGTPHPVPYHMLFVVGTGAGRTSSSGTHAFGHYIKPVNGLPIRLGFPVFRKGIHLFPTPCVPSLWGLFGFGLALLVEVLVCVLEFLHPIVLGAP